MKTYTGLNQFVAICATRNLTAAAEQLGISQPALTQAVNKLEKQLGVPLLDRSKRPLGITAFGELLRDYAIELERLGADLEQHVKEIKTGTGGMLRLGCGPDWIHEVLPRALCQLCDRNQALRVEMTVTLNDQLQTMLDDGQIELYFASLNDTSFSMPYETRVLVRDDMRIIARVDHPIHKGAPKSLEHLAMQAWAMTGDETFGRQLLRRMFRKAGLEPPRAQIETNSVRAMINLLRNGPFLGFLSDTHCRAYDDIAAVATDVPLPSREAGATWRQDRPLSAAAQLLLAEVETVIADQL